MKINVVYALTRNVYEWMVPSIRSLAEHHPDANVYIVCEDDVFPIDLPIKVKAINVSDQKTFPKLGVNYHNGFTYINLLKVCYPSLLMCDKVIHLDIDTIVTDKLDDFYNMDLTGCWVGAVPEYRGNYRPFGNTYYNMGVAVINLKQMREDNIEPIMAGYLNVIKQPYADQDAWNKYGIEFNKIVTADLRFNENVCTGFTDNPAIVHYCGAKDWWTRKDMFRKEYLDKYRK